MTLTIEDIRNPARKHGFDHVVNVMTPGRSKPQYRAQLSSPVVLPGRKPSRLIATKRATPDEAAQDYCDYINSNPAATPAKPALKSAGHNGRRDPLPDDPEVQAALGVLRDAKGQAAGKQGYVYCITDGEYVKIGFSTNPQARVAELQCGNARKLSIVGTVPGTLEDEARLHQKHIRYNVLAEWFKAEPEVISEFRPNAVVVSTA